MDTKKAYKQKLEAQLGKFDILYEQWSWEGTVAESFIFANSDASSMTDEQLEREVRKSRLIKNGSEIKIKRSDSGFTFVNFNFVLT